MESTQSPLVVFGPDHIDTSRAELLVQCLNEKIKEKRFKLQKMVKINEEKKKRNELMKNEAIQLTTKLTNIEQENIAREQQLLSEQARIKELQLNIQMLDEHNTSIKRDCMNEEQKYEQEKCVLISKFERTKQQWTEIFKPQYEQSKVYQYLKQGDVAYNSLVERKETLLNAQKRAYKDYISRRQEFCTGEKLHLTIVSMAKYYISRRDKLFQLNQMKTKLIELENKEKQLIENKNDKMKAWESVYTQPMKRDLMDFCLQTNIDQALTLSFNQIQQDIFSQPMTPMILTPQNEQIELIPIESMNSKSTIPFQSSSIERDRSDHEMSEPLVAQSSSSIECNRSAPSSILHLTTAIEDDDDELFSTSRRKVPPIIQLEQMSIHDGPPSTQAFVVSTTTNKNNDQSQNIQPLTQAFTTVSSEVSSPAPSSTTLTMKPPESLPIPSMNVVVNKCHSSVAFSRLPNRSMTSAIQPQVTSNDVQQMLLTFSPDPSSDHNEPIQPMEDESEQQQQRPTFSMTSSIESTTSIEDKDVPVSGTNFTSPISFDNWAQLGSPITTDSSEQFSAFLQQTTNGSNNVDGSFSFASFNYGDLGSSETTTNGTFGSFFFGNTGNSIDKESAQNN
ncbi:hypothetical protein I4U23_010142 [Adineta vaga]|nr:hypothetical protein I4U23_010142 [Adineta vaga]